eukprot:6211842-Pleurochrysis_carterae.AAC.4
MALERAVAHPKRPTLCKRYAQDVLVLATQAQPRSDGASEQNLPGAYTLSLFVDNSGDCA